MVIDASATLVWCFQDEIGEADLRLLDRLRSERIDVPGLWLLELANALALAERKRRITAADTAGFLSLLEQLDIDVHAETWRDVFSTILPLSRAQTLTAYDAAYLDLAMRLGVPLASKDRALCAAAERVGVEVIAV